MENFIGKNAIETITSLTEIPVISSANLTVQSVDLGLDCGHGKTGENQSSHGVEIVEIDYTSKFKDQVKNKFRILRGNVSGMIVNEGKSFTVLTNSFPQEVNESVVKSIPSPSRTKTVVLKNICNDDSSGGEYIIELYNKDCLINSYNVTDYHGNYYTDEHFWNLSWSPDETKIAYIVEEKREESENAGYKAYRYEEDWGEKNDKRAKPQIAVLDFTTKEITVIKTESSVGHVIITKDNKLVFVQFMDKLKYGMIYCSNRYSSGWRCNMDGGNMENIIHRQLQYSKNPLIPTNPTKSFEPIENVRSLRYDREKHVLYFLSNNVTNYPHNSCSKLFKYDLNDKECTLIMDTVEEIGDEYSNSVIKDFPGLFVHQLPVNCCQHYCHPKMPYDESKQETFIYLCDTWKTYQTILAINERSGKVINLTGDKRDENYKILSITKNYILAIVSSPSKPPTMILGIISYDEGLSVQWTPVITPEYNEDTTKILNNINSIIKTIKNPATGGEFDIIIIYPKELPKDMKKSPLIIHPHGGPHSTSTFEFVPILAGLVSFGYTITMINYTGSLGYGQKKVLELVTKIGELDISDVYAAVEVMKKEIKLDTVELDEERLFYYGGSHGGFIGAHMISKYPTLFKACCLRNPVINCGGMLFTSDIPEWSLLELGLPWNLNQPPVITGDIYQKAFDCSPIKQVDQVVTPLLLLLGEMDRRVPRQDSFIYARLLKSKNKDVEVILFPNTGHPLDSVEAEKFSFESIILKFAKYIQ